MRLQFGFVIFLVRENWHKSWLLNVGEIDYMCPFHQYFFTSSFFAQKYFPSFSALLVCVWVVFYQKNIDAKAANFDANSANFDAKAINFDVKSVNSDAKE